MSNPLKFIVVVAAILLGILLYLKTSPARQMVTSNNAAPSSEAVEGEGDTSLQSDHTERDLWKTIAPCWNRVADGTTLPATLRLSFDADGGIAVPPEIERDRSAVISHQSLKSESQALQALAACAPYPMARSQQDVVVHFPRPVPSMPERNSSSQQ